ncbi:hypothetical protein VaNZ11_016792 [Volvox africanus]|uniref:Uncharacterized protein n=1 Tax=Volvox africanus TaxID=51714 RepID=A0ABQ5SNG7_9CHLO|nr:hypothetical protein VaNZ11_016792 [Volvox africanus]
MTSVEPSTDTAAADARVDILPSGEALRVVSGWLGMSVEEASLEAGPSASLQTAMPNRRQQFLGLGAKYLPHHKAVETATALDLKLRKRLERGLAARRLQEEEAHEAGRGGALTCGPKPSPGALVGVQMGEGPGAKRRARHPGKRTPEVGQNDSSDEDEYKAPAMGSVAITTSSKVAREAALLYAPVDCGSGKRKKAKGRREP